ncbi:hypothetical protein [Marininema halotolerans]|uniref:Uncharacterized protein n=1 Tax=Marininema halotolerans TaxID=1155944 RepID=A0A1I6SGC6_9BACL|nr:hypothetical protein [Marininema halotolerans]SFS75964.1 hypothetical protein SAMN05444972_10765 [Marininema halotolerans]
MTFFQTVQKSVAPDRSRDVQKIVLKVIASDVIGSVHMTDLMFQGGSIATVWTGHASEIQWSFDG